MKPLSLLRTALRSMTAVSSPRALFALDVRALAAFRVAIGVLLAADVLLRARDLRAHYADFGVLPVGPYTSELASSLHISFHLANGNTGFAALMFALTFLAALAVTAGYRTRAATIVAWVLLVSMQNRNPMVLNGGDALFRLLYFWGMFLPLGRRFSFDHAMTVGEQEVRADVTSGATIAYLVQVAMIYFSTAALKTSPEWWPNGTASYYALSVDQLTTPFGHYLLKFPLFLKYSTLGVYGLEAVAGFLILSPFYTFLARSFIVLALMTMHLSFHFSMRLGIFPWVDMASVIPLIPGGVFDAAGWWRARKPHRTVTVFFDGDCGFCKRMVFILKELFLDRETVIKRSQDDVATATLLEKEYSWVVRDDAGVDHIRFLAMVALLRASWWFGPFARALPLRRLAPLGDPVYRAIAARRGALGRLMAKGLPWRDPEARRSSFVTDAVVLALSAYCAWWNLSTIPWLDINIPSPWRNIGPTLRIDQKWNMFAPYPLRDDGWYVIDGELKDGTRVDVMKGAGPVTWEKPAVVVDQYPNARWRKFMMNIWLKSKRPYRLHYGRYLCRQWNQNSLMAKRLIKFDIVFMLEKTPPPGESAKAEKNVIWQHECYAPNELDEKE